MFARLAVIFVAFASLTPVVSAHHGAEPDGLQCAFNFPNCNTGVDCSFTYPVYDRVLCEVGRVAAILLLEVPWVIWQVGYVECHVVGGPQC